MKSQRREVFEALTQGGIRASSHPPVSISHQSSKSMRWTYPLVKYFYNFVDLGTHSPMQPFMPRIPAIAKSMERSVVVMLEMAQLGGQRRIPRGLVIAIIVCLLLLITKTQGREQVSLL